MGEEDRKPVLLGIDVGGTFTDFVLVSNGKLSILKLPTSGFDQSRAIIDGIKRLSVPEEACVLHGTTIATNALLERRGAKTALIATDGFKDILPIGRQTRPHLYRLEQSADDPLIPDTYRFEVEERVASNGEVIKALNESQVPSLADLLEKEGIESIAVSLIFSFAFPEHEKRVAALLHHLLPGVSLSLSSEILPEYREYERTATTAINAYVQPVVGNYLSRLESALELRSIRVMQSNGGSIGIEQASRQAARLVLSGPAGGVVGAFELARLATGEEYPSLLTFDMGGTSTDVALCAGKIPMTAE